MRRLSESAYRLQGQEMFKILARANDLESQGKSILHFELGDPDFPTPGNIVEAACKSLQDGETHYVDSFGLLDLRKAAAESMAKGVRGFSPDLNQVLVTPGGNSQLFYAMACTTNPGEEVIVPDPGFVSYYSIADFFGINAVRVPLYEKNEFRLNPRDVEKAITDKTRMIVINSPSNPTGSIMKEEEIRGIYELAKEHDLFLLSDEVYRRTVYRDADTDFFSPSGLDKCKDRTIVVNAFSKSYAMTGWRIGTLTAPADLTEKMNLLLETNLSCVPPFIQRAGIEALEGSQEPSNQMREELRRRRDTIVDGLNSLPNVSCVKPRGAFYAFPNITETEMSSREFADFMLAEAGVSLAPGPIFGRHGEGFVRFSYATSIENIKEGIQRMDLALRKR